LGSDTRSFLSVVRSLGRAGLTVDSAWTERNSLARKSRYLNCVHDDIPRYSSANRDWLDILLARVAEIKYDLVIPTNDSAILPLQKHREELEPGRFYLLDERAFEATHNKAKTHELALAAEVPVPSEKFVDSEEAAQAAVEEFGLPLILKPVHSFRLGDRNDKIQVRCAENEESLREMLPGLLNSGGVLAQKFFRGMGVGVEVLAREGRILASFQHERIHESPWGGASSYRKSVPLNPQLLEATTRLVRALEYTGVAMFEFKVNPQTKEFVLIEINGRFWGSLPLAIAAGADFPLWLYQMWVEGREEFSKKPRVGIYCRNLSSDIDWFQKNKSADRTNPNLLIVPGWRLISEIGHALTFRERVDTLTLDDPSPGLGEIAAIVDRARSKVWKRILGSPLGFGFRSALRRQSLQRLRSAKRVIFVCKGNICRSPFALQFAARLFPDYILSSAGYFPIANRKSPAEAVAAASAWGVDLSQWRSSLVQEDDLRRADAIVVFDEENWDTVRSMSRDLEEKTVILGSLIDGPVFIKDPYGKPKETFLSAYRHIAEAIEQWNKSRQR
jgi:protein-tyrosine-phosphatase/predicted ATP-grasp superfamily ATP-dependent carboligase